ncbi:MAG TPA: hypothetical protein VHV51_19230 [Polyangiaceae bacterium]|jgi:hypothetical protein|nr:hypothetical protein [Polyangiaceae bacterium]
MRPNVVCAILFLCAGCVGHGQDAHEPGDRLGTFHATGPLSGDTCQASALLGETSSWAFDVQLSRDGSTLYWLNGEEAIPGTIAPDGTSFDFESGVEVTLQAAQGARPGCIIARSDAASGVLGSSTTDVASFTVNMSFAYSAEAGSACSSFVGVEGGFATLPCSVSYDLTATRTVLPTAIAD